VIVTNFNYEQYVEDARQPLFLFDASSAWNMARFKVEGNLPLRARRGRRLKATGLQREEHSVRTTLKASRKLRRVSLV